MRCGSAGFHRSGCRGLDGRNAGCQLPTASTAKIRSCFVRLPVRYTVFSDVKSRSKARLVHAVRLVVVVALLWLLPSPSQTFQPSNEGMPPTIEQVRTVIPEADSVDQTPSRDGMWTVRDEADQSIGLVARTLPAAADVIGYRGPSEALLAIGDDLTILGVRLLESADTTEHVEEVAHDEAFFQQFEGWKWGNVDAQQIDGVSSATLTSLALANGIVKRMGGERPSLVFPDDLNMEELERWFPEVTALQFEGSMTIALDSSGVALGRVIRTGPLSDDVMGYQGPTEIMIWVDESNVVQNAMLRGSFDNQPYVRYCKTEYGFWARFKEKSLDELAAMDIEAEGIEGVSGATMTSLAVAETMVASAQAYRAAQVETEEPPPRFEMRWSPVDIACVLVLLATAVFRYAGWFRNAISRRVWLVAVVLVIGGWSGNLMSMALIAGWGAEGIAWRLAPGLTAVAAVAFLLPPLGKSNPYCNHLCPHGALQQLARPNPKSRRRVRLPRKLAQALAWLPGTLLVVGYVTILARPLTDLASWEPFHAYLFRVAPLSAFVLAGVTLLFSAFVPMGFCRMGCPTGRLIDYVRRSATSHRFRFADGVAIALLITAAVTAWLRH